MGRDTFTLANIGASEMRNSRLSFPVLRCRRLFVAAMFSTAWCALPAHAFGIAPKTETFKTNNPLEKVLTLISRAEGDAVEVAVNAMQRPVHEEITKIAYYAALGRGPDRSVVDGAEWNDNPPFRLSPEQYPIAPMCATLPIHLPSAWPGCWMMVFGTGSRQSAPPGDDVRFGPESPILLRSHFGDMQFLHAMAPDGDEASVTQRKILAWSHFAYMVAQGEVPLDTKLSEVRLVDDPEREGERKFSWAPFPGAYEQYQQVTIRDLFVLLEEQKGNSTNSALKDDEDVRNIAFGSVLHIIEDSFSKAHVLRKPGTPAEPQRLSRRGDRSPLELGVICEFHGYAHQDHLEHAHADLEEAFEDARTEPFVIEAVIRMILLRADHPKWDKDVRSALANDIFQLSANPSTSSPGKYRATMHGPMDAHGHEELAPVQELQQSQSTDCQDSDSKAPTQAGFDPEKPTNSQ